MNTIQMPAPTRHWLTKRYHTLGVAVALIGGSLALGVAGYHYIGALPWIDALLEASMILGGEGPLAPMHSSGVKLFASAYALYSGLMLVTITGILLAPGLHEMLERSHTAHKDRKPE